MASNDMRSLIGTKPTGQRGQQLVSGMVSSNQPAPTSFTDTLWVVMSANSDVAVPFTTWPASHGTTLPEAGDVVLVGFDENDVMSVVRWDGPNVVPPISSTTPTGGQFLVWNDGDGEWEPTSIAQQGIEDFYFTPTASGIAGVKDMLGTPYSPISNITTAGVTNGQVLASYITLADVPGQTFLPAGSFLVHQHAYKSGGTKNVQIYGVIYETDAAGTVLGTIGTTETSTTLAGSETEYSLYFVTDDVYTFASTTSRLKCTIVATVTGNGTNPSVVLYAGGEADSHVGLPVEGGLGSPIGPAGGALSGYYPNPTLAAQPFFFGTWADVGDGSHWPPINLPIITTTYSQAGMSVSGGGCKVPVAGVYDVTAYARIDADGVTYSQLNLLVNGTPIAYDLGGNTSYGGIEYPFWTRSISLAGIVLAANDIITVQAGLNPGTGVIYSATGWPGCGLRVAYRFPYTGV